MTRSPRIPTIVDHVEQAIRDGRHSRDWHGRPCGSCGEWSAEFLHKTESGLMLCRKCSIACGAIKEDKKNGDQSGIDQ
jgi:hypothetical protein